MKKYSEKPAALLRNLKASVTKQVQKDAERVAKVLGIKLPTIKVKVK